MNEETLTLLQQLAPDLMEKLMLRAMTLERISALQPVGRRALAQRLHMPEREVRSVCDALKDDGLISVTASGMTITQRAETILPGARDMVRRRNGLGQLEQHLAHSLNVHRVCIVPGDADESEAVLDEIGQTAAVQLVHLLTDDAILTVSGGRAVAAAARCIRPGAKTGVRVLPARGGLEAPVETQAGTLAAEFARALGGRCSLFHLPDSAPPETLRELAKLPEIGEPLRALRLTDVLFYAIDRADEALTAQPPAERQLIHGTGAAGEAAGCYFSASGRQVYQASGVGLNGEEISRVRCVAAVSAGTSRAGAILSVLRHHPHELLVIDEGAAQAIQRLIQTAGAHTV